ncbi:hypothetical protein [Variovorax sp. PAMC26660]|uniref:hypothetical protein n=1 Tax=Variovorax sp. PAMC26660 TaxID=2762322 RepID=UPI00164EBF4E|nr:hypothetical protein [Variovorax sp. PAMC26660]QNK67837.1 hypothetical protein H7F35_32725 [Variovorax sp. PAMC26660]
MAAANPRSLGHDLAAQIVAASMQQMEDTIAQQKADLRSLSKANDSLKDEVGELKTANEVLRERLGTKSKIESLRGLFGVGGAALLGVAIDLYKAQFPIAVVVAAVGAVLVVFSVFGVPERKAK